MNILTVFGGAEPLFYLLAAVTFGGWAAVLATVDGRLGTSMLLAVLALTLYLRTPVLTWTPSFGSTVVLPLDAITFALLIASLFRWLNGAVRGARSGPLWVLLAIFSVNAGRGISNFGPQQTLAEGRVWLYLLSPLLYAATLPITSTLWWRRACAAGCAWLALNAVVGFAETGVRSAQTYVSLGGELVDPRPVTAGGASFLGITVLLGLAWARHVRWRFVVAATGLLLLALQHRTLWVAMILAAVYMVIAGLRAGGRNRLAALLGSGAVVTLGPALLASPVAQGSVLASSAQNDSTFLWRLDGWEQLLSGPSHPMDILLGKPFGTGFERMINGAPVTVAPHSQYVETYLRFGVVGVAAVLVLVTFAWRAAPGRAAAFGVTGLQLRAVLVLVFAFGVTYRWDPFEMIIVGTLLSAAGTSRSTADLVPAVAAVG